MTGGVLATANIEVDVLPVLVSFLAYEALVVLRVHIAEIVSRRTGKARHGVQLKREHCLVVHQTLVHHFLLLHVPSPFLGASQWRLACLCRLIGLDFRQFERQTLLRNHLRHAVLIVYGERFAPVALAREDGVTQTIVHLYSSHTLLRNELLCCGDGFLHGQSVEREAVESLLALSRRVGDGAFLGIEALLADVSALDKRYDGKIEVLCKSIVT